MRGGADGLGAQLHDVIRLLVVDNKMTPEELQSARWANEGPSIDLSGDGDPPERLRKWRGGSPLVLPIAPDSSTAFPASWIRWIAEQPERIADSDLKPALKVARFALGTKVHPERALDVLRYVIGLRTSPHPPVHPGLELFDAYEAAHGRRPADAPPAAPPSHPTRHSHAEVEAILADFRLWLEPRYAKNSVGGIVSCTKQVIQTAGTPNPTLDGLLAFERTYSAPWRLRWAWNLFAKQRIEQGHGAVVMEESARPLKETDPPLEVEHAIYVLSTCLLKPHLRAARWSHVQVAPTGHIAIQGSKYPLEGALHEAIQVLRAWGNPASGAVPLIPAAPSSGAPMPLSQVRTIIRDYPLKALQAAVASPGGATKSPVARGGRS